MPVSIRFVVALLLPILLAGCITVVEGTTYTERPAGYYSTSGKWEKVRRHLGTVQQLPRDGFIHSAGGATANIYEARLRQAGYPNMVCRQHRQHGVIVVYCAHHGKLQTHLHNPEPVFYMRLQPAGYWGEAPAYIDFQRIYHHRYGRYRGYWYQKRYGGRW